TKGMISDVGVVTWQSLTRGLAIGQVGTIGLSPKDRYTVFAGLWHNGSPSTDLLARTSNPIGEGDGFQAAMDASGGIRYDVLYYNCNAGFGGSICRAVTNPLSTNIISIDDDSPIWSTRAITVHWSDPYRP